MAASGLDVSSGLAPASHAERDDVERLLVSEPLRAPALEAVADTFGLTPGALVLDVGCGLGRFATSVATRHRVDVVAVDLDLGVLSVGARLGTPGVSLCGADRDGLPFPDRTFDVAWSVDCVGYPVDATGAAVREMVRVVRPGGRVALAGWTDQRLLPGQPLLESALNATASAYAPFLRDAPASSHFERAASRLVALGLRDVTTRLVVHQLDGPLDDDVRAALRSLIGMLWVSTGPAGDAWEQLQRMDQAALLGDPSYHAWFAYTVVAGTVAA